MTFSIYLVGYVILIMGLAYAATLVNISTPWIVVGVLVMVGLAVLTGAVKTRQKDPAA